MASAPLAFELAANRRRPTPCLTEGRWLEPLLGMRGRRWRRPLLLGGNSRFAELSWPEPELGPPASAVVGTPAATAGGPATTAPGRQTKASSTASVSPAPTAPPSTPRPAALPADLPLEVERPGVAPSLPGDPVVALSAASASPLPVVAPAAPTVPLSQAGAQPLAELFRRHALLIDAGAEAAAAAAPLVQPAPAPLPQPGEPAEAADLPLRLQPSIPPSPALVEPLPEEQTPAIGHAAGVAAPLPSPSGLEQHTLPRLADMPPLAASADPEPLLATLKGIVKREVATALTRQSSSAPPSVPAAGGPPSPVARVTDDATVRQLLQAMRRLAEEDRFRSGHPGRG